MGKSRFLIRVMEKGLSEVDDGNWLATGNNGGVRKSVVQEGAKSVEWKSGSTIGNRLDKVSGEECGWKLEAINALCLEKSNDMAGSQSLHQNVPSWNEEVFGVGKTVSGEGGKGHNKLRSRA